MILNRKRYAFLGGMAVVGAITYVNRSRLLDFGLKQVFKALPPDDPDNGQHVFTQQHHGYLSGPRTFHVADEAHKESPIWHCTCGVKVPTPIDDHAKSCSARQASNGYRLRHTARSPLTGKPL